MLFLAGISKKIKVNKEKIKLPHYIWLKDSEHLSHCTATCDSEDGYGTLLVGEGGGGGVLWSEPYKVN